MFLNQSPYKRIARSWKVIAIVSVIFAIASFCISILFPLEYRADAQILIISKTRSGIDPYTVVKSSERVGENIAQVMKTGDFYSKVKTTESYGVDWDYYENLTERKKRKLWNKSVVGSVVYGTGILNVSVYNTDPEQALVLVAATSETIVKKGWEYVGGDVSLKVVNNPIVTQYPVRPNIIINVILGFLFGIMTSVVVIARR